METYLSASLFVQNCMSCLVLRTWLKKSHQRKRLLFLVLKETLDKTLPISSSTTWKVLLSPSFNSMSKELRNLCEVLFYHFPIRLYLLSRVKELMSIKVKVNCISISLLNFQCKVNCRSQFIQFYQKTIFNHMEIILSLLRLQRSKFKNNSINPLQSFYLFIYFLAAVLWLSGKINTTEVSEWK